MNPYVWSQLRHRRRRAVGVAAAVAVAASLFVALTALGEGFRAAAAGPLEGVASDLVVTKPRAGGADGGLDPGRTRGIRPPFNLESYRSGEVGAIRELDGVTAVAASLQLWDFGPRSTVTVAGVDPRQSEVGLGRVLAHNVVQGRAFDAGERRVAVLDVHYAGFYQLGVGSTVTIGGEQLTVTGIVELTETSQAAAANVYLPLAEAQRLAGMPAGAVNEVHVQVGEAADVETVTARIEDAVGPVSVITADSLVQVFGAIGELSARFSTVAAGVGILGGLILSWLAVQGLVGERLREIGLLKALGWPRRAVVRAFVAETSLLSVAGAAAGLLLGIGLALLLAQLPLPELSLTAGPGESGHAAGVPEAAGPEASLPVRPDPLSLLVALLVAGGGGTLAGLVAARRAAGVKPSRTLAST